MSAMYGVWHGPEGLSNIAHRINHLTQILHDNIKSLGYTVINDKDKLFDTITFNGNNDVVKAFEAKGINIGVNSKDKLHISLNETTTMADVEEIIDVLATLKGKKGSISFETPYQGLNSSLKRTSKFMEQDVFNTYKSETQIMRYIQKLADKDVGLTKSMISLGSCTMKLNAAVEMIPVSWPEFNSIHPFAPKSQVQGYAEMIKELEEMLCVITHFDACSLQPNSGASGEYAGLLAIQNYHESRGDHHRKVCLIP